MRVVLDQQLHRLRDVLAVFNRDQLQRRRCRARRSASADPNRASRDQRSSPRSARAHQHAPEHLIRANRVERGHPVIQEDDDISRMTAARRRLRREARQRCHGAHCGQSGRRCLQKISTSHDENPLQYGSQLQDEQRRRVARVDVPGVKTAQHHHLEACTARGAHHICAGPAPALATDAAAAAFARHHGNVPPGIASCLAAVAQSTASPTTTAFRSRTGCGMSFGSPR